MSDGISICILTYNVGFYNRLAFQKIRELTRLIPYEVLIFDNGSTDGSVDWIRDNLDYFPYDPVRLWEGESNLLRHGAALDFLVQKAKYDICCTLCSDAFPVSPHWVEPAFSLFDDNVVLAGIDRGWGRKISHYVCPSYLFGNTAWLRQHTFLDHWPDWDTGEKMGLDVEKEGKEMRMWPQKNVEMPNGMRAKACDYNGWVWHTWMTGRAMTVPNVVPVECEPEYHDYVKTMLRAKYNLDF